MEQQQADALALVAETVLHRGMDPGAAGEHYQVVVHVGAAVLANADAPGQSVLDGGMRVPAGTSQRLACDASRVVMRHDADGWITEVGARTRTIPPPLRPLRAAFGQGHHIKHWAHGGLTKLSNLAMLCRRHHRAVHGEGFQLERQTNENFSSGGRTGDRCWTCRRSLQCHRIPANGTRAQRCVRRAPQPANGDARLAGRAARRRLRRQRPASSRHPPR